MVNVIRGQGFDKEALVSLLTLIRTNFVAVTAKLDLDSGVSGTNFASLWNFAAPDPNQLTKYGWRDQGVLVDYLKTIRAGYTGLLVKLDADGGVADTDYAATNGVSAVIDVASSNGISQDGVYEGSLVKWLANYVAAWNATLAKLDLDGTVNGTDFNSLWAISASLVDTLGCLLSI